MKEQKAGRTTAQKKAERRWRGGSSGAITAMRTGSPVTFAILAITIVAFVVSLIPNLTIGNWTVSNLLAYFAPGLVEQPWRLLTVALVHAGFLHVALNMLSLYLIGRMLEPMIGSGRFLALYVIATIGGDAAASLLAPNVPVVGASGAIFGLFGALIVIVRRLGGDITSMLVIIGINFVYGFLPGVGVSWQSHLGGLVAGAIAGVILYGLRQRSQRAIQFVLLAVLAVALGAVAFYPALS